MDVAHEETWCHQALSDFSRYSILSNYDGCVK